MSDGMSAAEFAALVRKGLLNSDETYRDWTNGWGIADGGIEGFITTWIAKHIIEDIRRRDDLERGSIALELTLDRLIYDLSPDDGRENHFNRLLDDARDRDPEISESLSKTGRLDLVYYDRPWPENKNKMRPRGIVEVKRWFDKSSYPKDMRRIANLMNAFGPRQGGSLLYGCFVFFIFERDRARASLQDAIDRIETFKQQFGNFGCDCVIKPTLMPTSDGSPSKAAAVSVTFEAPGVS